MGLHGSRCCQRDDCADDMVQSARQYLTDCEELPVPKFQVASASSSRADPCEAVQSAAAEILHELDGRRPSLLICNLTCTYECEEVHDEIRRYLGYVPYIGCTSSTGVVVNQTWHSKDNRGFGFFAIHDPPGHYMVGHAETADQVEEVCRETRAKMFVEDLPDLVICFPTPGTEEEVLGAFGRALGTQVPIIGGSSADDSFAGNWRQMSSTLNGTGGVTTNGVVFALCWPSVQTYAGLCHGFTPTAHRGKITEMRNKRHIVSIDGESAARVYDSWANGALQEDFQKQEDVSIMRVSTLSPLGLHYGSDCDGDPIYIVIHPQIIIQEDKSITVSRDLKEGDELVCLSASRLNLVERITKVSTGVLKQAPFQLEDITGSYQIFSGGVMMAIKDDMPLVAESQSTALDRKPSMSACTFGQQGTFVDGSPGHGIFMFASVLFSNLKRSKPYTIAGKENVCD